MSYEKYSTDALVCGSFLRNTSDKTYLLFTREAGMVRAVAQSVREEKSKQRQALQDFSLVRVSLIPGKAGWRVAGVEPQENLFLRAESRAVRGALRSIVQFLRRFAGSEHAEPEVFDEVMSLLSLLEQVPEAELDDIVLLTEFRLLNYLGYIETKAAFTAVLTAGDVRAAKAALTPDLAPALRKAVEQAQTASHL